nr:FtsW/RodA/SpoVE family cell cycle protein [Clostridium botulinum]
MISSATSNFENSKKYIITQSLSLVIGLIFMFITIYIDYRNIGRAYKIIYIFNFLLLAGVILLGTGKDQWGAQRWIRIGGDRNTTIRNCKNRIYYNFCKISGINKRRFK